MFTNMKVKDIKNFLDTLEVENYIKYIDKLRLDERKSVQDLAIKYSKKLDDLRKEDERLENMLMYEKQLYKQGYEFIGGIDEVGRGPLAGPVVAAVVILPKGLKIPGVKDSKKINEKKREELYEIIKEHAIDYGIGIVENDEIDNLNILQATYMAMKKAISNLKTQADIFLIDAVEIPNIKTPQIPIIKGDDKSASIAAASIIAKVTRDRIMHKYHELYPEYDFINNKGYGTQKHYKGIDENGITMIHRKSFLKEYF